MRAILCALAFALCAPAWGAVYVWETVSTSEPDNPWAWPIESASGWVSLEWESYHFECYPEMDPACDWATAGPLEHFEFNVSVGAEPIRVTPATGEGYVWLAMIEISDSFLHVGDGQSSAWFRRIGDSDLWSLEYASEGPLWAGATGRWVLQQASVPAPGTLALLAPAALLAATGRRAGAATAATPTSGGRARHGSAMTGILSKRIFPWVPVTKCS